MILGGRDVQLSYFVEGEGPAVTLLHGFTQSGRSWLELISKMPPAWRWIVPDLRGHGGTATPAGAACTMEACTGDLLALWDHLGVRAGHLVGYSMGGRLALHVATHHPERVLSLMTIGAHAGLDEGAREKRRASDEELARRIESDGIEAFVDGWTALPLFAGLARRGPAFLEAVRAERLKNHEAGLACSLRGMGAGAMDPVWEGLSRVECPCTFVAGSLDPGYVETARRLAAGVPQGKVVVIPGAGHPAHQERPEALARVLADHLADATSAASSRTSH